MDTYWKRSKVRYCPLLLEFPGPCLSPLSRPPYCDSCGFRHGPTSKKFSMLLYPFIYNYSNTTLTADNIGTMFTELSPPTHLYIPRAPPPIHPLPPLMPWTQQFRPKPILAADFDIEGDFLLL